MNKCTSQINIGRENYVVMQIQNIINYSHVVITTFNQMTWLHIVTHKWLNIVKNDKALRGGPKQGPKITRRTLHEEQKLFDITVVILSWMICLAWPIWELEMVLVINALYNLF